ncbi:MAG: cell division protein FtsL [Spirochaetales bacterium]
MKRKDIVLWLVLALVPVLLFANTWQAYRYNRLDRAISGAFDEQRELVEKNKRHLAGIAALRSPARIDRLARNQLGLVQSFGGSRLELIAPPASEREVED